MSKIIVLSESDFIADYLRPIQEQNRLNVEIENHTFELDDRLKALMSDEENIIVLDGTILERATHFIDVNRMQCHALIFVAIQSITDELIKVCEDEAMLMGVIDMNDDCLVHVPIFNLALRRVSGIGKQDLIEVSQNLNETVEFTLSELQRIKSIHERLVPVRSDDLKGLQIASKFAAGESSGGEFFDMIKSDQECLLLLTNSKSYVVSSLVLSHFEIFRESKDFSKEMMKSFIKNLNDELSSKEIPEKRKKVDMFVARIDLKKMMIEGYNFGNNELITSDKHAVDANENDMDGALEESEFEIRMSRGDKLMLLSPGVKSNSNGILSGQNYLNFAKEQVNSAPRQCLDEMFYQLKRFTNTSFLKDDASIIFFEVKPNVIVQV